MGKTGIITALCAFALLAGGCDFIRIVAGRPTSEYLEAKRVIVERAELLKRQQADSIERARKMEEEAEARAIAARESFQRLSEARKLIPVSRISNLDESVLDCSYYVMIGSFTSSENALALAAKAQEAGFEAVVLPYRNGRSAVALDPCDDITKAEETLSRALLQPFCPADAWILTVE